MGAISLQDSLAAAAELIGEADGLVITAGAGMGIDSGLPDFRGDHGFWRAYPALGRHGMRFHDIASPAAFRSQPRLAWGFYGHRLQLYRETIPHAGFTLLRDWAARMPVDAAIFTSNVDGQFQKAGFVEESIAECHGSIHFLQCLDGCGAPRWPATSLQPTVDRENGLMESPLPVCTVCGGLARPNILMFGDWEWDDGATVRQLARIEARIARMRRPVVIEIGAGTAIPTVRRFGEQLGCPLIRINPSEPAVVRQADISLPLEALDALGKIQVLLEERDG